MSAPLIQDALLIQEIDRLFGLEYGNKESETAKNITEPQMDDPRSSNLVNSQLESIANQRHRAKRL